MKLITNLQDADEDFEFTRPRMKSSPPCLPISGRIAREAANELSEIEASQYFHRNFTLQLTGNPALQLAA